VKGHIRERSPGHWAIVIDIRDPSSGRRRRKWHSFAGTKRQAQIECARLISAVQGGSYLEPRKITSPATWSGGLSTSKHKCRRRPSSDTAE
jgi:hypothetical protein